MFANKEYAVNDNDAISELLQDLITDRSPSVKRVMNIWIDMVDPPHVFFFRPIIEELNNSGHVVFLTAGEHTRAATLLSEFQIQHTLIGNNVGNVISRKVTDFFKRGSQLKRYAKRKKIDRALVFNSPSLTLAARALHIPSIVFMDYEYEPLNHLMLRLCDKVVVPQFFPDEFLLRSGAIDKTIKYNGFKEQVYLSDFQPEEGFFSSLNIDENKIIATVRPPTASYRYQRFANGFFYKIVDYLLKNTGLVVIAIPNSEEQERQFISFNAPNLILCKKQSDRRNLVYHSDIVVSGSVTLNHEAAVLGIPTYGLFMGKIGAVDRHLINLGRIIPIESFDDVEKIQLTKAYRKDVLMNHGLTAELVNHILTNGT